MTRGTRLKSLREIVGWSKTRLAQEIGCAAPTIRNMEEDNYVSAMYASRAEYYMVEEMKRKPDLYKKRLEKEINRLQKLLTILEEERTNQNDV